MSGQFLSATALILEWYSYILFNPAVLFAHVTTAVFAKVFDVKSAILLICYPRWLVGSEKVLCYPDDRVAAVKGVRDLIAGGLSEDFRLLGGH